MAWRVVGCRPVAWDVVARDARAEEVDKFADVGGNEAEVENNSVDPGRLVSSGRDTFETGV